MSSDICNAYSDIQLWQSISNLEKSFDSVFDSKEAGSTEKRLRIGRHGRIFKLFGEEVQPLIWWLKSTGEFDSVKFFVGNEHFDAMVRSGFRDTNKIEIGLAIDGYFERLLNEFLSTTGIASPFAKYGRIGKGNFKNVEEIGGAEMRSQQQILDEHFRLISKILQKKSKNSNYDGGTILVVAFREWTEISTSFLSKFSARCIDEIGNYRWDLKRVDIVGSKTGLICSKIVK